MKFDVLSFIVILSKHNQVQFISRKSRRIEACGLIFLSKFPFQFKTNFNSILRCSSNENTITVRYIGSHLETFGMPSVFSASKQKLRLVPVVLKSAIVVSTVQKTVMGT